MDIRFSGFFDAIKSGRKVHAIRFWSKPPMPGEKLELRAASNDLIDFAICTKVLPISIDPLSSSVVLDGAPLLASEIEELALDDGFEDVEYFWKFFEKRTSSETGWLICWDLDGQVNHPLHYNQGPSAIGLPILKALGIPDHLLAPGVECIQAIEELEILGFPFSLLSAIKYLWRAGSKSGESAEKDLKKAKFYLARWCSWVEPKTPDTHRYVLLGVQGAIAQIDQLIGGDRGN